MVFRAGLCRLLTFHAMQGSEMLFLGDKLLEIDGVKVHGKPVAEVADLLLGPAGTPVELSLQVHPLCSALSNIVTATNINTHTHTHTHTLIDMVFIHSTLELN